MLYWMVIFIASYVTTVALFTWLKISDKLYLRMVKSGIPKNPTAKFLASGLVAVASMVVALLYLHNKLADYVIKNYVVEE